MDKFYKRTFLTLILSLTMLGAANAQALEDVMNSARSGNITAMTKYFDNIVAITINNNQATYSKTQAEMVLKDFYFKNPVKDLEVVQSGSSGNNSQYFVGNLSTANGSYQLYVVLKVKEGQYVLQEIRFEKTGKP